MPGCVEFVEVDACSCEGFFAAVILDFGRIRSFAIRALWIGVEEKVL